VTQPAVRVAVAGCGAISRVHLRAIAESQPGDGLRLAVAGVYDQDPGRARERAQEFGLERVYTSWTELLGDRAADVVAVLLPHDLHNRFATEALAAGHHVVVEKPMATTLADCDAMIGAARRAGKQLHPVHNRVYDPASEAAQAFLAEGAIGEVFLAQTVGLEPPQTVSVRPWLGTPAGGGGVLLAQAVHPAYVLRWLLGDVAEVACFAATRKVVEMTAEDTAVALLRFRSGAVGEMTGTFGLRAGPYEHGITLYGPEGYVEISSRRGVLGISPRRFGDREPHPLLQAAPAGETRATHSGFRRLWEDYARGFATGAPTRVTDEDGKRAVEIILAAYRSVADGRAVPLPLP
jgi:UDP-N-acetyl-2-amino-2-deoxyglucuronate dehydrogenase